MDLQETLDENGIEGNHEKCQHIAERFHAPRRVVLPYEHTLQQAFKMLDNSGNLGRIDNVFVYVSKYDTYI